MIFFVNLSYMKSMSKNILVVLLRNLVCFFLRSNVVKALSAIITGISTLTCGVRSPKMAKSSCEYRKSVHIFIEAKLDQGFSMHASKNTEVTLQ